MIVSSPMVRARQTADVLSFHLGLPVYIQPNLEETDKPLLDVPTGNGALAMALAPLMDQVTAVDVKPHLLEQAELARLSAGYSNVYVRWADPARLTFPDNSFDLVTCAYGLHHLPDAAVAIHEMARVCRPGKRVLIHDLVGDDDPVKRATQNVIELRRDNSHVTLLTADHIRNLVTAAELEIDRCDLSETEQRLDDWLKMANADEDTVEAVSAMLDAAIEGDAAGMQVHRERDGRVSFRQRLITLFAYKPEH